MLEQMIKAIKEAEAEKDRLIIEIAKTKETQIIQANKDQLFSGKRSDGQNITPKYTQFTITRKRRLNQPFNRVTLKDTGGFYDSIDVEYREDEFEITADDKKTLELQLKYRDEILGLSDPNLQTLIDDIKPQLTEEIRSIIFK